MKNIRKLIFFVRPYWKLSLLALVLLTSVVVMDLAIPRLIQRIIDEGIARHNQGLVIQTAIWMIGISIVQTVFAVGNNNLSVQVGESVARDLREALFLRIHSFSFGNLDHLNTGQLMVRLSSDTNVFQRMVQVSLRIGTRAPLLMLGSLVLMVTTDRRLALMMLPLLLTTGLVIGYFIAKMEPLFKTVQQKLDQLNMVLQENIAGVRVVKSFVREEHEEDRFARANENYTEHNIRVMEFMATMSPAMSILVNIGIVLVIWSGGLRAIQGQLTIGQIVAFANYLQTALGPLTIMVMLANVVAAGMASSERIIEVLETVPEVQDAPGAMDLLVTEQPMVAFENVSFHYNGEGGSKVLDGINLVVEPGQTVAILGATGAGKSTLANLIPRFYEPSGGQVTINGIDIRQVRQDSLLAQVGIVPQETVLFSGSVADNIRYGCPSATDAEVEAAARAAQAHDFIRALPEGYATHVEARGVNLSGGQKQRIAIARALLMRPGILILDDSTSSVDVETETRIQEALKVWMQGRTSFVIAQRISTVLNADQILVIDRGHIAAQGTHRELLLTSPIYQEIYASQLGNGIKET